MEVVDDLPIDKGAESSTFNRLGQDFERNLDEFSIGELADLIALGEQIGQTEKNVKLAYGI